MNKRKPVIIAIDTSNYTTSAACSTPDSGYVSGGFLITQEKIPLKVKAGERGLRQSDAVFAHTVNLPTVMEALLSALPKDAEIRAVGVSSRPRNAEGSYMPCFLSGEAVARTLSAALGVPLYRFSHQEGHIAAAAYSAVYAQDGALGMPGAPVHDPALSDTPFLAFHVSGGTTDLLHVVPTGGRYEITPLGTSLDLHAGQVIDRIGVALGLAFPAGPALEALAASYEGKPSKPKICVRGFDCNLSGVENLVAKMRQNGAADNEIAAFTFAFLEKTLCTMTENALAAYPTLPVLYAGGVMSNHVMRKALANTCLEHRSRAYFSAPAFSADNAAGVSLLACRAYLGDTTA